MPEDLCYKLPDNMTTEEGALMEPTAVAVHICRQGGIKAGDKVVVYGAGPVGLLCAGVAKALGATKIVSVDINEERLQFAQKYAATNIFRSQKESAQDSANRLIEECGLGEGADVILDASGAEPCIQAAIYALRQGGTYVQVSPSGLRQMIFNLDSYPAQTISTPYVFAVRKQLKIKI